MFFTPKSKQLWGIPAKIILQDKDGQGETPIMVRLSPQSVQHLRNGTTISKDYHGRPLTWDERPLHVVDSGSGYYDVVVVEDCGGVEASTHHSDRLHGFVRKPHHENHHT